MFVKRFLKKSLKVGGSWTKAFASNNTNKKILIILTRYFVKQDFVYRQKF